MQKLQRLSQAEPLPLELTMALRKITAIIALPSSETPYSRDVFEDAMSTSLWVVNPSKPMQDFPQTPLGRLPNPLQLRV